jgi:hypothetical protein
LRFCASAWAQTGTRTYVFQPDQSTVVETGGVDSITATYTVEGRFRLTVDFDTNSADFNHVDANLSESVVGGYGQSLDDLFDMTDLVGTVVSDTRIEFDTADPMPGGKIVHLDLTFAGNSIHLTGGFREIWLYGFCYTLDAVAVGGCTYYVDAVNGDDDNDGLTPQGAFASIQVGIDAAADGDSVIVDDGTYVGQSNTNLDFAGRAITLRSRNGPQFTIIDCQNDGRGFYFHSGEDANSVLDGFTITRGLVSGPWSEGRGGGICCVGSGPTIKNCVITRNSASHRGGGIFSGDESNAMISQCTISENSGGGVFFGNSGTVVNINSTITHCIIARNSGSGITCYNSLYYGDGATITHCTISDNSAGEGGGIRCRYNTPNITNCIISGNSSTCTHCSYGGGGGIFCEWRADPTIDNCIISGNSTASAGVCGGGGGIHCNYESHPTITNSTIVSNTTGRDGGGIFCTNSSSAAVVNTIIWSNTAEINGPDIALVDCNVHGHRPGRITVSYSDVKGGRAQVYVEAYCTLNWGLGNIKTDPCFAEPGFWAHANDPNVTVEPNDPNAAWIDGDYHLRSPAGRWDPGRNTWVIDGDTSSCIDAGNPDSDWTAELWPHGKRINMGAFGGTPQASMSLSGAGNIADLNNDGAVGYTDLMLFTDEWPSQEILLPQDLDRNGVVNFPDFAIFANNWLREE